MKSGTNELEIEVANLWPNRLIGDATLPKEQRRTVTNVRTYDTMETPYYGCRNAGTARRTGNPPNCSLPDCSARCASWRTEAGIRAYAKNIFPVKEGSQRSASPPVKTNTPEAP